MTKVEESDYIETIQEGDVDLLFTSFIIGISSGLLISSAFVISLFVKWGAKPGDLHVLLSLINFLGGAVVVIIAFFGMILLLASLTGGFVLLLRIVGILVFKIYIYTKRIEKWHGVIRK